LNTLHDRYFNRSFVLPSQFALKLNFSTTNYLKVTFFKSKKIQEFFKSKQILEFV